MSVSSVTIVWTRGLVCSSSDISEVYGPFGQIFILAYSGDMNTEPILFIKNPISNMIIIATVEMRNFQSANNSECFFSQSKGIILYRIAIRSIEYTEPTKNILIMW